MAAACPALPLGVMRCRVAEEVGSPVHMCYRGGHVPQYPSSLDFSVYPVVHKPAETLLISAG